jgi:hypothetical protein
METAMTTRRRPKKSLGNLLREEAQKDKEPDVEPRKEEPEVRASSPEHSTPQGFSGSTSQQTSGSKSRSNTGSTARSATRRSKAAEPETSPEVAPPVAKVEDTQAEVEVPKAETLNTGTPDQAAEPATPTEPIHSSATSESDSQPEPESPEINSPNVNESEINEPGIPPVQHPIHLSPRTTMETSLQPLTQTSALTVLPRSANFQTLALPRAFTRPMLDRPTPWEIPHRPLVITGVPASFPSDLSDEDLGWFD